MELSALLDEISKLTSEDPKTVELMREFMKQWVKEMPWLPMFGTSKFVPVDTYYWTNFPDVNNYYEGPLISAILVIFNWPWPARQTRAMALSLREREFVNTAWFSGEGSFKIITTEIFPYITAWTMANFVNTVLVGIATESGLAVIGLSSLEEATLGTMIYWALQHQALLGERWWWIGSPVVAIITLFIALFLTSTGLSQHFATRRGH